MFVNLSQLRNLLPLWAHRSSAADSGDAVIRAAIHADLQSSEVTSPLRTDLEKKEITNESVVE